MTTAESAIYFCLWGALTLTLAVCAWLCYRRTGSRGFLFLGAVLILWPWFDWGTTALMRHFLLQAIRGQKPWLFPFSLVVRGGQGGSGAQMSLGEFVTKFSLAKELLRVLLLTAALALIARSQRPTEPAPE